MGPKRKSLSKEEEVNLLKVKKKPEFKFAVGTDVSIEDASREYFKLFIESNKKLKFFKRNPIRTEADLKFAKKFIQRDAKFDLRRSRRKKKKVVKYDDSVFKIPLAPAPRMKRTPVSTRPRGYKTKAEAYKKIVSSWNNSSRANTPHPESENIPRYVDKLYYNDTKFRTGDIVTCEDPDHNRYYAIIRHLIEFKKINELSCTIAWLLRTTASPPPNEGFDPDTYLMGPNDDVPRKLDFFEFVMRCPGKYYAEKIGLIDPYPWKKRDKRPLEKSSQKNSQNQPSSKSSGSELLVDQVTRDLDDESSSTASSHSSEEKYEVGAEDASDRNPKDDDETLEEKNTEKVPKKGRPKKKSLEMKGKSKEDENRTNESFEKRPLRSCKEKSSSSESNADSNKIINSDAIKKKRGFFSEKDLETKMTNDKSSKDPPKKRSRVGSV